MMVATATASAFAQVELAGSWAARNHEDALERGPGPYAVDYTGLPLNDEGRARALSYSASQLGVIERQCGMWPAVLPGDGPVRHEDLERDRAGQRHDDRLDDRRVGRPGADDDLDGRASAPSALAPHMRGGFTTGAWDGNTLVAYTTHMKAGVDSAQRRAEQRPGDDDDEVHPARRSAHGARRHRGPGVPERT